MSTSRRRSVSRSRSRNSSGGVASQTRRRRRPVRSVSFLSFNNPKRIFKNYAQNILLRSQEAIAISLHFLTGSFNWSQVISMVSFNWESLNKILWK